MLRAAILQIGAWLKGRQSSTGVSRLSRREVISLLGAGVGLGFASLLTGLCTEESLGVVNGFLDRVG